MKWSQTFIPTLKETPSDAEVESHKLMIRSGMIRKLSAGIYSYLPLGTKILHKVTAIIREEMDKSGAIELSLPALQPLTLLELSGRIDAFGDDLLSMKDRHKKDIALSPTHEEVITDLVKNEVSSYKQLPLILYQIQTKFRDEARPRFGVLRSKEFLMKDAYSFDTDDDSLNNSYQNMYDTYCRIFKRCKLDFLAVEADTGAMGGDVSHEFMVPNENGEDVIAKCRSCDYSANREKAEPSPIESDDNVTPDDPKEVSTPNMTTIKEVSNFLNIESNKMVKTLIYTHGNKHVAVLVRGDHDVNEAKLSKVLSSDEIALANEETVVELTDAPVGFAGPIGLNAQIIADQAVTVLKNCVVGGNKADTHIMNVNPDKDFKIDRSADIRFVTENDRCPKCNDVLDISNGIELGHVFKLGTRYSDSLGAKFLDKNGKERTIVMGSYGIGVNRILAATIEKSHDSNGIIWPLPLAPYEVLIVPINFKDETIMDTATKIYDELCDAGIDTLLDDRDQRPGFKFKDADLIGIPIRITVGKRLKETGELEIKLRSKEEVHYATPENLLTEIRKHMDSLR
ncbi:MAG: proline--tRNA ligase [Candidatus Scalindua rubra]|uniref:Proline--tRNA ligase n=1 Tax=Candidatus Scalindua brodae TaxID=237368 RepID=A0A0B0EE33_9BACT|nr:MAG: prolyl-tRNA synthetase [Candidatus Scalindua brodae]MBZ0107270.1 proline--tRNA ligase [Candidatus Scalindua rubra]TWU32105.1 Proline--tRNA ligase [Candidatus Brocadiaceae bacterium S225]